MFALDIKLEDAIKELGEAKDAFQWEVKPDDEVHEVKDLSRRQFEAVAAGRSINTEIRAFHARVFSNKFFTWLFSKIEASIPNKVVYFETVQNALEASTEGEVFFVTALEAKQGILVVVTQKDESPFDPKTYIESNAGWFYRPGVVGHSVSVQRGRGFQAISENRDTYVSFERLGGDLLTIIYRPFDVRGQETAKYNQKAQAERKILVAYLEIVKVLGFEFDDKFSDMFPDCSDETQQRIREKLLEGRPDLLAKFEDIVRKMNALFEDRRPSVYRNIDSILKEYEID